MKRPSPLLQIAVLPVVMWAGFLAYTRLRELAGLLMPLPDGSLLTIAILMSQGFLAATLMAVLVACPLAWLYGRGALMVAGLIALPVVFLRLPELLDAGRHPLAIFMSAWDLLVFVGLLTGGTWLARRILQARSAA